MNAGIFGDRRRSFDLGPSEWAVRQHPGYNYALTPVQALRPPTLGLQYSRELALTPTIPKKMCLNI